MTIIALAVVGIGWLAVLVVHLHYHGYLAQRSGGHSCDVVPSELVCLVDRVSVPLCPVHQVLKHRDTEGMIEATRRVENNPGMRSIKVSTAYSVQLSIHPVQLVQHQVYSQSIRPGNTVL